MLRKLFVYIACSLDGFIAAPGDDLSFLSQVEREGQDYGSGNFFQTVGTVMVGWKTFDWVKQHAPDFWHKDRQCFVITRTARPQVGQIQFYTGDIVTLVATLKQQAGKNIFCDGGAEIVNLLLQHKLVDEIIISIIPTLLGDGTRLFNHKNVTQQLELVSSKSFESGLVQLHYMCR